MGSTMKKAACLLLPWTLIGLREVHQRMQAAEKQQSEAGTSAPQSRQAGANSGEFLQPGLAPASSRRTTTPGPERPLPPPDRPWHSQKARKANDNKVQEACEKGTEGTFLLGLQDRVTQHKCVLRDVHGTHLCKESKITVTTVADSCARFWVSKVKSCGPKDLKCKSYDCGGLGVLRLESSGGELVDPGTKDKMLTCGNVKLDLVWEAFCATGDESCEGPAAWTRPTSTSTPQPTPVPVTAPPAVARSPAPAPKPQEPPAPEPEPNPAPEQAPEPAGDSAASEAEMGATNAAKFSREAQAAASAEQGAEQAGEGLAQGPAAAAEPGAEPGADQPQDPDWDVEHEIEGPAAEPPADDADAAAAPGDAEQPGAAGAAADAQVAAPPRGAVLSDNAPPPGEGQQPAAQPAAGLACPRVSTKSIVTMHDGGPAPNLRKCALVGTSHALRGKGLGVAIDEHSTVIRIEKLPRAQNKDDYGLRTSVYFKSRIDDYLNKGTAVKTRFLQGPTGECNVITGGYKLCPFESVVYEGWKDTSIWRSGESTIPIGHQADALQYWQHQIELLGSAEDIPKEEQGLFKVRPSGNMKAFFVAAMLCSKLDVYAFTASTPAEVAFLRRIAAGDLQEADLPEGESLAEASRQFRSRLLCQSQRGHISVVNGSEAPAAT